MGHQPIEEAYREKMNNLAALLDGAFNGESVERKVGFVLLCFEFGKEGRCNYISNAERKDMVTALKEVVARFEGQAEISGRA